MTLQALVVSKDDDAADVLSRVFAGFGVAVERFSEPEIALQRLAEQRFDCLVVDFDQADTARHLLETVPNGKPGVIIPMALLSQESDVRKVLSGGAKFILRKPLAADQTAATLRAVTALLRRERRRSFRVPVQAPAQLALAGGEPIEGILLDLSQTGIDVLAAQALHPAALIGIRFELPDASGEIDVHGEVAWANPNGQSGVRFLDMPEAQAEKLKAWRLLCRNRIAIPGTGASRSLFEGWRHGDPRRWHGSRHASGQRDGRGIPQSHQRAAGDRGKVH